MRPILSVTIVPRLRRGWVLWLPATAVLAFAGCGHKREAMRPVIMTPAPAAAVPCPTPSETVVDEPSAAVSDEPSAVVAPPAGGLSTPERDSSANPASTSPPRPAPAREEPPYLKPNEPSKGSSSKPPQLDGPETRASKRVPAREVNGGGRQSGLRQTLRSYVNDPDDLFSPPKADRPWKYVVLHHSSKPSGNYEQIDREHRKVLGWDGCGYHFVIGNGTDSPDGQIEVARRWSEQKNGVHCRNGKTPEVNEYGIGICLIGDLDDAPPTAKQIAAARALVAYLSERYQIPTSRVETHAHLANSPTICPGKYFPSEQILASSGVVQR